MVSHHDFTPPQPPSDRDKAIFQSVTIEGRPTDEVAAQYELSTRQVQRIVRRTAHWQAVRKLRDAPEPPWLRAMHRQRLEHQWQESMLGWYRSLGDQRITKVTTDPDGRKKIEQVQRGQNGDVRFLEYARRILVDLLHLGGDEPESFSKDLPDVDTLTLEQRRTEFIEILDRLCQRAREDEADGAGDGPDDRFRDNGRSP